MVLKIVFTLLLKISHSLTGTRRKGAQFDQQESVLNPQSFINSQHADGCSPNGCQSCQPCFIPGEMVHPSLSSRIEERMQGICLRIVTCRVWAFEPAARSATQCQILHSCGAIMFLRPNMIEMKRSGIVVLWELTVFTTTVRSFPDRLTSRKWHSYSLPFSSLCFNDSRALA